jgi:hypothetical protein
LNQYGKDKDDPSNPFQRAMRRILNEAVKNNADCFFIGMPTAEYKIEGEKEPKIKIASMEEIIEEMEQDSQSSDDDIQHFKEFHQECQSRIEAAESSTTIPLEGSPVERLPIWHCKEGKCIQQDDSVLLFMFTEIIDTFVLNDRQCINISEWSKNPTQVYYTIRMQKNFCFSVTINKIEKIPNK